MNPHRPFNPAKLPFYYGWAIVIVGSIGVLASVPGQTVGVSVFTDHISEATGLSRLQLSIAYLCGTGASAIALPIGGRWIDRYGSRVVSFGATIGLSLTLIGLSFITSMSTPVGMAAMIIGFGLIRFTGQGLLTLSSRTMISQWFDARRGLVNSVSNSVVGFSFSLAPAILFGLIETSGFRVAWRQMAIGLALGFGLIVLVFFRDTPESSGLEVDGDASLAERIMGKAASTVASVDRSVALRDIRFWIVTLPVAGQAAITTALTFHIVDFGREVGMQDSEIIKIFLPIALVSVPVSILGGWLVDRVSPIQVAVAMSISQLIMYLTVSEIASSRWRIVAIISWGIAQGCYAPLTSSAIPRFFGRTHLGAINGAQMSAMVFGSAIGPAFFASIEQFQGSYRAALLWSTMLPIAALSIALPKLKSS